MPKTATKTVTETTTETPASEIKTSLFTWRGPVQGIELKIKDRIVFEGTLVYGKDYELPVDHDLVNGWKTSGLVTAGEAVSTKPPKKDV